MATFDTGITALSALTVVCAALAAYFSYHVYKKYGILSGGPIIPAAMFLLFIQRLVVFLLDLQLVASDDPFFKTLSLVFFFLFAGTLTYGMWVIKLHADDYAKVNKDVNERIRRFEQMKAKKAGK